MSTLVFTLLTFCPPAPPLLAKLVMTSSAYREAWKIRLETARGLRSHSNFTAQCTCGAATVARPIYPAQKVEITPLHGAICLGTLLAIEGRQESRALLVRSTSAYPLDEVLSGGARRLGAACHMARRPPAPPAAPPGPRHTTVCPMCKPSLLERRALRLQAEEPLPAPPSCSANSSWAPGLLAWQE